MATRTSHLLALFLLSSSLAPAFDSGLPLYGAEAERFLAEAQVVGMKPIGVGITKPMKVTLTDGERTLHAVWKTIDDFRLEIYRDPDGGGVEPNFRDSYRYEVAAYELDKLLGLGLVPPTVVRTIKGRRGSLQMWVEGAFTELERREKNLFPKGHDAKQRFSAQLYDLRLLNQLVFNADQKNIRNVIYDSDFTVYAIDNSRSFRRLRYLTNEAHLVRFSRSVIEALQRLDAPKLEAALGEWLSTDEIDALLARRDLLVDAAAERVARYGEERVFYP